MGYYWEWDHVKYMVVRPDGTIRKVVEVPVPGEDHAARLRDHRFQRDLFDLPVTFQLDALSEGYPFPYRWEEGYQARVGVLPREGRAEDVRWADVEPCYVYHPLNAYDLPDGRIVIDVARHPTDVRVRIQRAQRRPADAGPLDHRPCRRQGGGGAHR